METDNAEFQKGWCMALDAVEASLREYPNAGGHKPIMDLIEEIEENAVIRGQLEVCPIPGETNRG